MSRTYRRQKGYLPNYVVDAAEPLKGVDAEDAAEYITNPNRWYRSRMLRWYRSYAIVNGQVYQYGAEKAFGQKMAMWFGDHGYAWRRLYGKDTNKFIRNHTQTQHRSEARQELAKYWKNPDYEVIIPRKNLLPWD